MSICFTKKHTFLFLVLLSMFSYYAYANKNHPPKKPQKIHKTKWFKFSGLKELWRPGVAFFEVAGGLGTYSNMDKQSGNTAFTRLGVGLQEHVLDKTFLGFALGIQTGNSGLVDPQSTGLATNPNFALPVSFIISSPVDILLDVKQYLLPHLFAEAKCGGVYLSTSFLNADITGTKGWKPELQLAVGLNLNSFNRITFGYQEFFGQSLQLMGDNINSGTASFSQLPTWKAFMITVDISI